MRTLKNRLELAKLNEEQQRKERKLEQLFKQMEENMQPEDYKDTLEQFLRIIRIFPPKMHEELMDALLAVKVSETEAATYAARQRMGIK